MTDMFGTIVTNSNVESAVQSTLKRWIRTYLAEMERQSGREAESLPMPRSWALRGEMSSWPENQVPAVVVTCPGLSGDKPRPDGRGVYTAWWAVGVGVVVSARTRELTRELAGLYSAAVRAALLQHPNLKSDLHVGGFAESVEWVTERTDDIPDDDDRNLAGGSVMFNIEIPDVVDKWGGPKAPPEDPYDVPDLDEIEDYDVSIETFGTGGP